MPVKVKAPKKNSGLVRFFLHPAGKAILAIFVLGFSLGLILFTYYYAKYSRLIEAKLNAGPFAKTSMLYAAPRTVMVGDEATAQEIAADLRRAGYSESRDNRIGHFAVTADGVDIYPGPDSYFKRDDGVIKLAQGKVARIISLADNTERTQYALEPELMSNLFDKNREKRRIRALRRYSAGAGARRDFGRRQALLSAFGIRPDAHREGGLARRAAAPLRRRAPPR